MSSFSFFSTVCICVLSCVPPHVRLPPLQDHLAVGMGMGGAGSGSGTASGGSSAGGGLHVPVCAETLPARLREWVVDPAGAPFEPSEKR